MLSRKLRFLLQILGASLVVFLSVFPVSAQEDADPNSPTPVLISSFDSTRALAANADRGWRGNLPKSQSDAFALNQKIVLFVTNIELMEGEGANAFRVYIEDSRGRQYRFPVLDIQQVKAQKLVYGVTIQLTDEIGYWAAPEENGDVLVNLTWRGLTSNRVRLGLGATGGDIKDDAGARPTPLSIVTDQSFKKGLENTNTQSRVGYRWSGDRMRFLEQATFGPTQALDDRIRRIGLSTWLAEQFDAPYPSATNPYPNVPMQPTTPVNTCDGSTTVPDVPTTCNRDTYTMYLPQTWFYKEALYGTPQLRHRVAWALSQIIVVSAVDTQQSSWLTAYHLQLSNSAFGNYRQIMTDITLNPAMGNYLDMIRSTKNNPNENYAREVLQLFNIGLFMLNQDGTLQRDSNNQPIPTYDQNTVNNFTKVFTGWQTCETAPPTCPSKIAGAPNYKDQLVLNNNNHDLTAKTLLSYPGSTTTNIAACTGCTGTAIANYGNASMAQALRNIFEHPNVAPFVSKLLIQHLVTSDPTPAYVGRVAAVFTANRENPRQLKEVVRAILLDPEARGDVKTDPRYGKLREPVQFMTNIYRAFNVASFDGLSQSDGNIDAFSQSMGQRAFFSPTVFNYYPPDYVVPGTSILGPEYGIYTTGTSIARANVVNNIVFNRIAVSQPNTPNGTSINFDQWSQLAAADTTSNQLLDALNWKMLHGTMSTSMRNTIMTAVQAVPSTNPLLRAQTAIYLIATSSQYQVQR